MAEDREIEYKVTIEFAGYLHTQDMDADWKDLVGKAARDFIPYPIEITYIRKYTDSEEE